jgi:DNA-binding CsgD family transcriptional regulator/predicted ATPase
MINETPVIVRPLPRPAETSHHRVNGARIRGRSRELAVVDCALANAATRRASSVLLLEGRTGTGKSRLLAAAGDAAAHQGFAVIRDRADELGRLVPFMPLVGALGGASAFPLSPNRSGWLAEIADGLRLRTVRAPAMVALDDLQWADRPTLTALRVLPTQLQRCPIVWVLSRRLGEPNGACAELFAELEDDGATRVAVGPLPTNVDAEIVDDVLGAAPDEALLGLAHRANGNPRILLEALAGLRDEGQVEISEQTARLRSRRLPDRVSAVVRQRLDRLPRETRQALSVAAVIGLEFTAGELSDLLHADTAAQASLDDAVEAGLLSKTQHGHAFESELVWKAVAGSVPLAVREALKGQVTAAAPASESADAIAADWPSLTDTERAVAALVSDGLTNRQIAERMYLSPHTVSFHLRKIFRKLHVRSRVDLTRFVVGQRLNGEPEPVVCSTR